MVVVVSLQQLGDLLHLKNHLYNTYREHESRDSRSDSEAILELQLDEVVFELRKRAEQHEADGNYRDAEYLYRRIIDGSDIFVSVRIRKVLVSIYEKLGDFPAAERTQEEIVSKIALSRSENDATPFDDEETLAEVRNLVRLYTLFKSRVALLDRDSAEMCMIHRTAGIDFNRLNNFLLNSGLISDSLNFSQPSATNFQSDDIPTGYETLPIEHRPHPSEYEISRVNSNTFMGNNQSLQGIVTDMLDEAKRPPRWDLNAFHIAATKGAINLAEQLLNKGADIESRSGEWGWTALQFATKSGHTGMMCWLLDKGAKIEAKAHFLETSLLAIGKYSSSATITKQRSRNRSKGLFRKDSVACSFAAREYGSSAAVAR